MKRDVIKWLLSGDIAIQFQTNRDLLDQAIPDLQNRISGEGWGARFLARRNSTGGWGRDFYQPKWTSTHYTLLDLKMLGIHPQNLTIRQTIRQIVDERKSPDGGINPAKTIAQSDVCVNGMFLNYACYFGAEQQHLTSIVDFLLLQQMADGGFNCRSNRSGAHHSSLHSTLSVLEGLHEYATNGYTYRLNELQDAAAQSREFILRHRLYKSDHTGNIIHPQFLVLSYPPRWKYNILRALDYFQAARIPWDERMRDALEIVIAKRRPEGLWSLQAAHPGQVHFQMERGGKPSRWNTLLALRILRTYGKKV